MNVGVQDRSTAVASPPTVIARRPQADVAIYAEVRFGTSAWDRPPVDLGPLRDLAMTKWD